MSWVRFREVPTFGRNTIRRFKNDISAMEGLAGRDYEDILQVRAHHCFKPFLQYIQLIVCDSLLRWIVPKPSQQNCAGLAL
jgi:hypothetical protein